MRVVLSVCLCVSASWRAPKHFLFVIINSKRGNKSYMYIPVNNNKLMRRFWFLYYYLFSSDRAVPNNATCPNGLTPPPLFCSIATVFLRVCITAMTNSAAARPRALTVAAFSRRSWVSIHTTPPPPILASLLCCRPKHGLPTYQKHPTGRIFLVVYFFVLRKSYQCRTQQRL